MLICVCVYVCMYICIYVCVYRQTIDTRVGSYSQKRLQNM